MEFNETIVENVKKEFVKDIEKHNCVPPCLALSKTQFRECIKANKEDKQNMIVKSIKGTHDLMTYIRMV